MVDVCYYNIDIKYNCIVLFSSDVYLSIYIYTQVYSFLFDFGGINEDQQYWIMNGFLIAPLHNAVVSNFHFRDAKKLETSKL